MSVYKTMKSENKRLRLEKIMRQICNDFGEFGMQERESIGLGIHPPRIYFNFVESEYEKERQEGIFYLKGSNFSMKDVFDMARDYKLVRDEKIELNYNGNGFRLAFDLRKLEEGELMNKNEF